MSRTSTLMVELVRGFDASKSPLALDLGATPSSDNYISRDRTLVPRPKLSVLTTDVSTGQPFVDRVLGGFALVTVGGALRALASGTTALAWFDGFSWSLASYVSAGGLNDPPAGENTDYWDWTQIYDANSDQNVAVGCNMSRQSLYIWKSDDTIFSTLTGAPGARCVAAFDNYLLAANLGGTLVQRVQWCDRGSISSWTGGTSGYEDLVAARGEIRRMIPLENRVLVLFDDETWVGASVEVGPTAFRFQPLDTKVGCPYPWTAENTPAGVLFMARDYQLYLAPKDGGTPQPVGQPLQPALRDTILQPQRSWGAWDALNQYQFYYAAGGDEVLPHRAAFLNLNDGAWLPQSFHTNTLEVTRGFTARLARSQGSTWNSYNDSTGSSWDDISVSWDVFGGAGDERPVVFVGSSRGTMYQLNSNATRDAGTLAVPAFWQSAPLDALTPALQKTVTGIALDYSATSASSLTVRVSPNQGSTFVTGERVSLASLPTSTVSQALAYPYVPSRYPVVRVESEDHFYRLHRLTVDMRVGGR